MLVRGLVDACSDAGQGVDASVAEPVAGALQSEDVGVVNDAVDHRGNDRGQNGTYAVVDRPVSEASVAQLRLCGRGANDQLRLDVGRQLDS